MIVTDRFVFLHLHKSGGTFVNEFLLQFLPDARTVGYHLPRSLTPAPWLALPAMGFVRSPWSYYVSWYAFQARMPRPNPLFRVLSQDGRLDFAATLRRMLDLGSDAPLLDAVVAALPLDYTNQGLNLPGPALASMRETGLGFYTFLHDYMFLGGSAPLHVGRMEHMRTDLPTMLAALGTDLSLAAVEHVRTREPRNVTAHAPYTDYYDSALRALVARRDAPVIETYRYAFTDR